MYLFYARFMMKSKATWPTGSLVGRCLVTILEVFLSSVENPDTVKHDYLPQ